MKRMEQIVLRRLGRHFGDESVKELRIVRSPVATQLFICVHPSIRGLLALSFN